jgi:hypothetical protein
MKIVTLLIATRLVSKTSQGPRRFIIRVREMHPANCSPQRMSVTKRAFQFLLLPVFNPWVNPRASQCRRRSPLVDPSVT